MDFEVKSRQLSVGGGVLAESVAVLSSAPFAFALITIFLVFPLSLAVLAQTILTHGAPIRDFVVNIREMLDVLYLLSFVFTFSLLSTAAVLFVVASIYASQPVSFSSTLSAIPSVLSRLFLPFLFFFIVLLDAVPNLLYLATHIPSHSPALLIPTALLCLLLLAFILFFSASSYLTYSVSVLDPPTAVSTLTKTHHLLSRRPWVAAAIVTTNLTVYHLTRIAFTHLVFNHKWLLASSLLALLPLVILLGLVFNNVFYFTVHHPPVYTLSGFRVDA